MKKGVLFLIGIMFFSSLAFAETVDSKITAVTLYSNQAQVSRELKTKVKKGLQTINLEVDAYNIDTDSVTAEVMGDGDVYSVQLKNEYKTISPQKNVADLEKEIETLIEAKRVLQNKKQVLNKKEEFLKSILNFSSVEIPKKVQTDFPSIDELDKTVGFIDQNFAAVFEAKQKLNNEIKELDKKIKVLNQELDQIRRPAQKSIKVIEIVFDAKKDQTIDIKAKYLVYNSFWKPLYKVDVSKDLKTKQLTMFAKIQQNSGEDWNDIKLSISNAVPLKGSRLPEARPWFMDINRPHPRRREAKQKSIAYGQQYSVKGGMRNVATFSDDESFSLMAEAAPMKAKVMTASAKRSLVSVEYDLPQVVSIESKNKETILPVLVKEIEGKVYDFSVPKENKDVFLVCAAKPDKEMLSGNLNVYMDGRFIGKTFIEEKKPGQVFYVNLGVDRGVYIKREKVKDKKQETFFGKIDRNNVVREIAYKITVENFKDKKTEIHLLDVVPVSKTDKIEIKDLKISPDATNKDYNGREGFNRWVFDLAAGKKKEIMIEFTVIYPKDVDVAGL